VAAAASRYYGREQVASGGVTNRILLLKHVISSRFLVFGGVTFLTHSPSFVCPQKNCRYCIRYGLDEAIVRASSGAALNEEIIEQLQDTNMSMNGA
jgi:hypothetical protein